MFHNIFLINTKKKAQSASSKLVSLKEKVRMWFRQAILSDGRSSQINTLAKDVLPTGSFVLSALQSNMESDMKRTHTHLVFKEKGPGPFQEKYQPSGCNSVKLSEKAADDGLYQ